MVEVASLTLTHVSELHRARREAIECAIEVLGADRADDVALVVSELSTNALEHGVDDEVRVRLGVDGDVLLVEVVSASEALPLPAQQVEPHEISGRGLRIVSELADALTVATAGRKIEVTCRFESSEPRLEAS